MAASGEVTRHSAFPEEVALLTLEEPAMGAIYSTSPHNVNIAAARPPLRKAPPKKNLPILNEDEEVFFAVVGPPCPSLTQGG
jgi:hypothetical protein